MRYIIVFLLWASPVRAEVSAQGHVEANVVSDVVAYSDSGQVIAKDMWFSQMTIVEPDGSITLMTNF